MLLLELQHLAAGGDGPCPVGVGEDVDCFPASPETPDQKRAISQVPDDGVFGLLVSQVRSHEGFEARLDDARGEVFEAEDAVRWKLREEATPRLVEAIGLQSMAFLETPEIQDIVDQVSTQTGLAAEEIKMRAARNEAIGAPSLGSMIHVRAARDVAREMKRQRGDFVDSAHASSIATADLVALDRRTASFLQRLAGHLGKRVVGTTEELIGELKKIKSRAGAPTPPRGQPTDR